MKKQLLIILLSILLITNISAISPIIEINIVNQTLTVSGFIFYNEGVLSGKLPANFITAINETINPTFSCQQNITNSTNSSVCSWSVNYFKEVPFISNTSNAVVLSNQEDQRRYNECIADKSRFEAGLNSCVVAKNEQGEFKNNYSKCSTDLLICGTEKNTLTEDKTELQKEFNDTKNQKWLYGIAALIIGYIIKMIQGGELFGPRKKNLEGEFKKYQAG